MIWKAKNKEPKRPPIEPKEGDIRIVKRFAIFPVKTADGYWVWMARYFQKQKYEPVPYYYETLVEKGLITSKYQAHYTYILNWNKVENYYHEPKTA